MGPLLDRRHARVSRLLVLPLAVQLSYSRIWRLGPRHAILYIAREIAWSAGSLWAVAGLRTQLEVAARTEQRILDAQRETARLAEEKAAEVGVWFRFHERLSVFNNVRSRAGIQSLAHPPEMQQGYRRIEELAKADHDRFRRDPAFMTLNALVARILTARPPDDGSGWLDPPVEGEVVDLDLGLAGIRWLLQIVQRSEGPLTISTDIAPTSVHLKLRSPRLHPAALHSGWFIQQVEGSQVLRGTVPRRSA